ncbi:A24 family peptidase C-terminal domain-containing protein [Acidianus manzaensis]|uniref:Peptidase A24 n=1 Tax=Acidianus manzaensis TaxID=282676 RepID=A0A1W6K3G6_9CREN|nr:A24 family peptidase C-terminal domain-containing protein [Acidianus manzaensis]ARM77088.1 peptidase A24 [Acidianus manzaensis]
MFIHASILDIKYREIDLKIWALYSPLVIFIIFYIKSINLLLYSYSLGVSLILLYIFYRFSLMGGADIFAILISGLANAKVYPFLNIFPTSFLSQLGIEPLVIMLYSSILIFLMSLFNFLKNFKYTKDLSLSQRILIALSAKRIKVKDFLNSKFLFPLTQINENGDRELRTTFSIEEDDKEWREKFRNLLSNGRIKEDDYIWVAYGIPVIPYMFIGFLLSLLVGFP